LFDKEAEDVTIGSILIGGLPTLNEAREIISDSSEEFHQERLRVIWESVIELADNDQPFDAYIINAKIGGKAGINNAFLVELGNKGNYLRIRHYAEIVHQKYLGRLALLTFDELKKRIVSGEKPNEVLSSSISVCSGLLDSQKSQEAQHVKDIAKVVFDDIEERYETKRQLLGVPTHFKEFDVITGGIRGITVLAGRPGMGKTTKALNIALNTSEENPVAFFSLEMDKEELVEKLISCEAGVDSYRLENGLLMQDGDWPRLAHGVAKIYDKNIYIEDSANVKASQIAVKARRMKQLYGIKLIIIDYLQLIAAEESIGNDNKEISDSLKVLKGLNKELKTPILLLSQMNRNIENRQNKKPTLADLRGCGSIEQDAHIVDFLYQEDEEQSGNEVIIQSYIPKNRKGRKNVEFDFKFLPAISKFELIGIRQNQQKAG
jgi:replicative DNA helicase